MLKGREIEAELRNRGFEKGTEYLLREMFEALYALQLQQTEIASAVTKLADAVMGVAGGYAGLRKQVETIGRNVKFEQGFDGDKG